MYHVDAIYAEVRCSCVVLCNKIVIKNNGCIKTDEIPHDLRRIILFCRGTALVLIIKQDSFVHLCVTLLLNYLESST